jgi:hypothetical protein
VGMHLLVWGSGLGVVLGFWWVCGVCFGNCFFAVCLVSRCSLLVRCEVDCCELLHCSLWFEVVGLFLYVCCCLVVVRICGLV